MGSRVEQFEQIRRDRDREGLSIRALAERHGVHRRAVQAGVGVGGAAGEAGAGESAGAEAGSRIGRSIDAWLDGGSGRAAQAAPHGASGSGSGWSMSTAPRSRRRRSAITCARASGELGWPVGDVVRPADPRARRGGARSTGARREVDARGRAR